MTASRFWGWGDAKGGQAKRGGGIPRNDTGHRAQFRRGAPRGGTRPTIRGGAACEFIAKKIGPRFGVNHQVIETRFDHEGIWPAE